MIANARFYCIRFRCCYVNRMFATHFVLMSDWPRLSSVRPTVIVTSSESNIKFLFELYIKKVTGFSAGPHHHLHIVQPGIATSLHVQKEVKSAALTNIFTSAVKLARKILAENVTNEPTPTLPTKVLLTQTASQHHKRFHPKEPAGLNFEIN